MVLVFYMGMKAWVAEDDPLLLEAPDHRMKDRIVDIGRVPIPIDDPAPLVDYNAQLASDDPAVIRQPFLTDGLLRPAVAHRMDQLDAIAIDHSSLPPRKRGAAPLGSGRSQRHGS